MVRKGLSEQARLKGHPKDKDLPDKEGMSIPGSLSRGRSTGSGEGG